MPDLENPRDVKELRKRSRLAERERQEMLKALLSMPQGRRWMYELLSRCKPFHTPFSQDAMLMAFSCGEQNIGFWLLGDIVRACPELYIQMMQEAGEKDATLEAIDAVRAGVGDGDGDATG